MSEERRAHFELVGRRSFLAAFGLAAGGLAVGVFAEDRAANAQEPAPAPSTFGSASPSGSAAAAPAPATAAKPAGLRPNAFVHVAPDGTVTIVCHRSEMGQGVRSSIPVLIAEEMGADPAKVVVVQGDGDKIYGDQNTDGSSSVRGKVDQLRQMGAFARAMLVIAAANRWQVRPSSCRVENGVVTHPPTRRRIAFAALVADAARLPLPTREQAPQRTRAELTRVGSELLPLLDGKDIVTGRAIYGADVKIPGMLTAVCVRPPVVGGRAVRHDESRAAAVPGVKKIVPLPAPQGAPAMQPLGGFAVVAENTWAALKGAAALTVTWSAGRHGTYDSAAYKEQLLAAVRAKGVQARSVGNVDRALHDADRTIEAEYYLPHLAHAPMEPPVAIARAAADACEVWAPTQDPQGARELVAKALGLDVAKVTVHVTLLGGAFGRKGANDFVVEAALVSRAMDGAPVRVQWTREDDVRHDYYHTVNAQKLVAAFDKQGDVTAWVHRTAFPPIATTFDESVDSASVRDLGQGVLDLPLAVLNVRAEVCGPTPAHVRTGWLRSVNNIFHAFGIGCFVDEIAHAKGADPRDVWLSLIGRPRAIFAPADLGVASLPNYGAPTREHPVDAGRLRQVIERVTDLSGWTEARRAGRALGLAAHRSFLSYVGVVVAVIKDERGRIAVDEAWIVADAGMVINAERVKAQMEGAVVFGMSLALYGEVTMKNGAVEQTNFRDYPIVRLPQAPRAIHVELVTGGGPSGGVGEPGVPPVAPAIANAVFALTGKRIRELPLSRAGLV